MAPFEALLWNICSEIEGQSKPNLQGFKGLIVKAYLPQVWTFKTKQEVATVVVDAEGNATRAPCSTAEPSAHLLLWR